MVFNNREEAGELLRTKLQNVIGRQTPLILAIPRGGVILGKVIADKFNAPLDILVVKKIGAPDNPELAIGAVGPKNTVYWDEQLCRQLEISKTQKQEAKKVKQKEQREREELLRNGGKPHKVKGETVILVDDGVATGATVIVAAGYLRKEKAGKIILAVPVVAKDTLNSISKYFDKVIFLSAEESFYAVGQFYRDFPQVTDEEVIRLLNS